MSFASKLKNAMDEQRLTQTELSKLTGIGKSSISQYLSAKHIPQAAVIEKLAAALDTTVDDLKNETIPLPDMNTAHNMSVHEAANIMGKSAQFVRVSLQRGLVPFGWAVKMSGKYSYYISPRKFKEYMGIDD